MNYQLLTSGQVSQIYAAMERMAVVELHYKKETITGFERRTDWKRSQRRRRLVLCHCAHPPEAAERLPWLLPATLQW